MYLNIFSLITNIFEVDNNPILRHAENNPVEVSGAFSLHIQIYQKVIFIN